MFAVSSVDAPAIADRPVPADLPVRLAARGIDVVVIAALDFVLGRLIGFGWDWLLLGSAMVLAYFALLDTLAGATVGKLVLGLRVIGPDGGKPSLRQSVVREAFTLIGSIPFVGPLLAIVVWVWFSMTIRSNPLRQGKHDQLAGGTRVVRVGAR
ncbi:RDD family protein [Polyangium aurulentum]|uniref:RDD family protein n=1 Tax=Polyangium aurulentum TaxID=2567896 RepID=UPI00146CC42F|nr:RDD family protein [Polyangium aurulentum]